MKIPVRHQGTPLLEDFPFKGQWLDMPRIFLFEPTPDQKGPSGKPQLAAEINPGSDDWCFGFDASQIAVALEVSVDELFSANSDGRLVLANVEASADGTAKRYTLKLGDKVVMPVFERFLAAGRA